MSSDESDIEEDIDSEPTLKYDRLHVEFAKESASCLEVGAKFLAIGTHAGSINVVDFQGNVLKRYQPHLASVLDIDIDTQSEYIASASIDGKVLVAAVSDSNDQTTYDLGRPVRCIALEPDFAKKKVKQFVAGGMAGMLVMYEKGWLGQKETPLHSGEGPIWAVSWRTHFIAWANDEGIRIYDTRSSARIAHFQQESDTPRPDLFKYTFYWQDDKTVLVANATYIRVIKIKEKEQPRTVVGTFTQSYAQIHAIFQVDCMVSGIVHFQGNYLIAAYVTQDMYQDEATNDPEAQKRKEASRPELRIISAEGDELSADALALDNFSRYQCNDYALGCPPSEDVFYVISPNDLIAARPRDAVDHVHWLVESGDYEGALQAANALGPKKAAELNVQDIGINYLQHLISAKDYETAARHCPAILASDSKAWEDYIFLFIERGKIQTIIPYVPTKEPQLSSMVYEMMLAHFLRSSPKVLLETIRIWPTEIYDPATIISAIEGSLPQSKEPELLKSCLADLFTLHRQFDKALPYYLELRRPETFDLIKENNLFTFMQDKVVQLLDFDRDLSKRQGKQPVRENGAIENGYWVPASDSKHGPAIDLLCTHVHSIPVSKVVEQLRSNRRYLYMYLDALFDIDSSLAPEYADLQIDLYAEYEPEKLMEFWRAASGYDLERAYNICVARDLVAEQVFLLARMGNSKKALALIIEKIGDVQRAIEFAKEQNEDDLWEDLLTYSESRPNFIRELLKSVGANIDPIRLIKRIQNGLEIPGLRDALIKILQDYNLQISLIEGCESILQSDCRELSLRLYRAQSNAFHGNSESVCYACRKPLYPTVSPATLSTGEGVILLFLCRHIMHASCAFPSVEAILPSRPEHVMAVDTFLSSSKVSNNFDRQFRSKMRFMAELRSKITVRCHICDNKGSNV